MEFRSYARSAGIHLVVEEDPYCDHRFLVHMLLREILHLRERLGGVLRYVSTRQSLPQLSSCRPLRFGCDFASMQKSGALDFRLIMPCDWSFSDAPAAVERIPMVDPSVGCVVVDDMNDYCGHDVIKGLNVMRVLQTAHSAAAVVLVHRYGRTEDAQLADAVKEFADVAYELRTPATGRGRLFDGVLSVRSMDLDRVRMEEGAWTYRVTPLSVELSQMGRHDMLKM